MVGATSTHRGRPRHVPPCLLVHLFCLVTVISIASQWQRIASIETMMVGFLSAVSLVRSVVPAPLSPSIFTRHPGGHQEGETLARVFASFLLAPRR